MRDKLRRRYQVEKEVSRNGYFEGVIPISELERLTGLLHPDSDVHGNSVSVRFEFLRNEYDLPTVTGRLETTLLLECQRCLEPMEVPLELDFSLMVDASDNILRESSLDSIDSEEGYIDIFDVVEDELILAAPLVAVHEDADCNRFWPAAETGPETRDNPFAVLAQLKND